jgi:exodeoxyribonuclease V beta subunit
MLTTPLSLRPYLAYSASAGSGKTFALSVRYISLLFMGESPRSILAATFTNKAAAEMRERVLKYLQNLGDKSNKAFLDALSIETGLSRDELISKRVEVLDRFLSTQSYIVTLDSFFSSILRSASIQIDLEPDFVTKEISSTELESHLFDELYSSGRLALLVRLTIDIEDRRLDKIFDLMQDFYRVDPLLPAKEYRYGSIQKYEEDIEKLRLSMIKLLREAKATPRAIKQFETSSTKELFSKGLFEKEYLGEHSWFKKVINEEIETIYIELRESLLSWVKAKEAIVLEGLFQIYTYYKNAKITSLRRSGILSFDDLTYMTYRLLYESISREFLYFKIDSKFHHILLDEFQDTSTLQFLLLKPIIDEIFAGEGQSEFKSFFYVGDTKQSLYRFRGGVEELFDRVSQHYNIDIEEMNTNYRSSKNIVRQVNNWFLDSMPNYKEQRSRDEAEDGYVKVVESEDPIDQSISRLKELMELGVSIDSIAILVSTNRDGLTLQERCELLSIPTILQTTSSLRYTPKIASLVEMIKYLFYQEEIYAQALLNRVDQTLDRVDLSWFDPFLEPIVILDRLVRDFGYFDNDITILKLLEFASNFSDIPTFLDEFDRSSISVAGDTISGIRIMTIHGSKGLEFDHVIVVDKLTRKNSDRSPIIYDYDNNLHIEDILYRISKRENFDSRYKMILNSRKISATKDHKNILYVALTRAVHGLTVVKKPKESIFEDIGLSAMEIGILSDKKLSYSNYSKSTTTLPTIDISNYGTQEIERDINRDDKKDQDAIIFGTALHYLLEMLGNFDKDSLDMAMTSMLNRYGRILSQATLNDIYNRANLLINDTKFQKMLIGADIKKEQSISFDNEIKQIDLLLEYRDYSLVVDYKSSQKYQHSHIKQVNYYQKAIENITKKTTKGMIIYLLENDIKYKFQELNS